MTKRLYQHIFMGAAILTTMASCKHKELCYDHPHSTDVNVVFDWTKAPQASPKSMALYLFPEKGGEALRYEFTDHKGGSIRVPTEKYKAVCLNSDTKNITYPDIRTQQTFYVSTPSTQLLAKMNLSEAAIANAPRAEGTEKEPVHLAPDMIWTAHMEDIDLKNAKEPTITLYPEQSVSTCTVEIRNAKNLKYVNAISGTLSSMAAGLFPGKGSDALSEDRVTIPFEAKMTPDKGIIDGQLRMFGHCSSRQTQHSLIIYAVLADASKWYHTYDVTDQVHNAPDQRNIHIVLDGLPIPKPLGDGSGFNPSVDNWHSVDVEIEM
ncbi:DUF5119 domain-containing protein [Alistipes sp.]|uniref:DUF5119 domain-containing protein n=1 Tax=Alistipes sp. TaxID=1872444 RepID=UPI0025BA0C54|nr:DUF5119 domain-containing protein [Alistipes sp.]